MSEYLQKNSVWLLPISIVLSAIGYVWILYYLPRTQFNVFISIIALLFGLYFLIVKSSLKYFNIKYLLGIAAVLRVLLLFATPNLSDDFYRFVWDGRLIVAGKNPYLYLPNEFPENPLFSYLNSPNYYTVYPPFNQFIFGLASWFFPENLLGNIVMLRIIIVLADVGVMFLLYQLKRKRVLLYAFNPLIIIELTGNLHFEGLMIFWFLSAICFFVRHQKQVSGRDKIWGVICFTLSVATKLIPLIFLPLIIKKIGFKNGICLSFFSAFLFVLLWLPFFDREIISNFFSSIDLYFQSFQFNACVYYIIREIGFLILGFDVVWWVGGILGLSALSIILNLSWGKFWWKQDNFSNLLKNEGEGMTEKILETFYLSALLIVTTYYFFATTVHPWYIATVFTLSLLTPYRFGIVWSAMVMLSYFAYRQVPVNESLYLIAIEYLVVIGTMLYELKISRLAIYPHQK
ncbi:hypothetical protein VB776_19015 [Arcicella sp. DC2W]|uniref:Mannosyltransferase n=1 Tax=Arcicella gelida TaxID=2984195 RepID=A0ABU5SA02_9BACT|nr:hypothetical protein [Arcicella sp. DC2W]MEA5405033.1 hypothetical protein [Arcicella sp. DC2W]